MSKNVNYLLEEPKDLNRFNWGAFIFGGLWGLFNGIYWPIIVSVIIAGVSSVIPADQMNTYKIVQGIATLAISLYLGFNGSKIAWDRVDYYSVEKFYASQRMWTKVGLGLVAVFVVSIIILMIVAVSR